MLDKSIAGFDRDLQTKDGKKESSAKPSAKEPTEDHAISERTDKLAMAKPHTYPQSSLEELLQGLVQTPATGFSALPSPEPQSLYDSQPSPNPTFPNPPPGPQRDMAYQPLPTTNPMYAPSGMLPPGTLDMAESPFERLMREETQRRAQLQAVVRYRLDQETLYAEWKNRQLEIQREKAPREGRRREEMMNGPPPRDAEPTSCILPIHVELCLTSSTERH